MRQKKVVTQLTDFFTFTISTKIAISKFKCLFKSITKYDFKITYNTHESEIFRSFKCVIDFNICPGFMRR